MPALSVVAAAKKTYDGMRLRLAGGPQRQSVSRSLG
jgi:hypothetical protein